MAEARHEIGAERFRGKRDETGYGERYFLGGLECQVGHASIPVWEQEIARVVVDLELDPLLLKELSGLFEGLPLHGEDLVERWRRDATYIDLSLAWGGKSTPPGAREQPWTESSV